MKRFTETEKWRDPWFASLSTKHKILWLWLCDRVDNSGVIDIHWPIASVEIGETVISEDINALGERVERMENGKFYLPSFVKYQFGDLSKDSGLHKNVLKLLKINGLLDRFFPS